MKININWLSIGCIMLISVILIIVGSIYIKESGKYPTETFIDPTEYYEKSKDYFTNKKTYSYKNFADSIKSSKIDQKDINPTVYNMSKFKHIAGDYSKTDIERFIDEINNNN